MRRLLLLSCVLLLVGCKKDPPVPVPFAVDAALATADAAPVDAGPKAATAEDKKRHADYVDALVRGRKATLAKKWPDAMKAFDDALALRPRDDRALAEKGYAEYLAKDVLGARRDLEAASNATDPTLASQIWFNLGLLDEAAKDSSNALVDFWLADKLHPNLTAQAKIAGKSVCPVTIDRTRVSATHATSWLDVVEIFDADESDAKCKIAAKTENEARAALLKTFRGDPMTGSVMVNGTSEFYLVRDAPLGLMAGCPSAYYHALEVGKSDFWIYPASAYGFDDRGTLNGETEEIEPVGTFLVGRRVESVTTDILLCSTSTSTDGGSWHECGGEPGEELVQIATHGRRSSPVYTDDVIDPSTHALVLSLTDAASNRFPAVANAGRSTTLRSTGSGLELVGLGCNVQFSRGDGGL